MNFETAFAHYQDGAATAEEKTLVERELEKHRRIEEYLAAQELPELPPDTAAQAAAETKAVKRRLGRRTRRTVLAMLAVLLALLALLQFVVSPLLNRTVYDDSQKAAGYDDGYPEFDVAMSALAALYMPLGDYFGSYSEHTGFMSDTIHLTFYDYTGNHRFNIGTDVALTLGRVSRFDTKELLPVGYNHVGFFYDNKHMGASSGWSDDNGRAALEDLPEYLRVTSAVSFSRVLSVDELAELMARYPDVVFLSANVWVESAYNWGTLHCSLHRMMIGYGSALEAEYPGLQFLADSQPAGADIQQHFEALLQYLADHPDAAGAGMDEPQRCRQMLQSAREDGIEVNGVWVQGTPSQLMAMLDDEYVRSIVNYDARIDLYG